MIFFETLSPFSTISYGNSDRHGGHSHSPDLLTGIRERRMCTSNSAIIAARIDLGCFVERH
jgi:hypothetical protein